MIKEVAPSSYLSNSKIYEEVANDYSKAKEELGTFFLLKATSKVPIQIWKTEYERPGQHFEYIRKYIVYYIKLLENTRDLEAFGYLSKCLRKFKTGMLDHQEVWEFMCTTVSRILKEILYIPAKYTDAQIQRISHQQFTLQSENMKNFNENSDTPLHPRIKYLNYTAEIRRLNNGFGSTAALDDVFVSLYLMIYNDYVDTVVAREERIQKLKTSSFSYNLQNPTP